MPFLPYMPFYGNDFFTERVRLMSRAEQAVYLELLWIQWREGSLPVDREELERLVNAEVSPRILEALPVCDDRRRRNAKLEGVREERLEIVRRQSEGGKKGRQKQLKKKPRTKSGVTPKSARTQPKATPGIQSTTKYSVLGGTGGQTDTEPPPDARLGGAIRPALVRDDVVIPMPSPQVVAERQREWKAGLATLSGQP